MTLPLLRHLNKISCLVRRRQSSHLLFESQRATSEAHSWAFSYPVSEATTEYQPIKLFNNFYYINAIESTASTMEASILGAKTVVDLAIHENQLQG